MNYFAYRSFSPPEQDFSENNSTDGRARRNIEKSFDMVGVCLASLVEDFRDIVSFTTTDSPTAEVKFGVFGQILENAFVDLRSRYVSVTVLIV